MKVKVTGFTLALALVLVLSPFLVAGANAEVAKTIVKNPTSTAGTWDTPTNAYMSDDNYATQLNTPETTKQNYTAYNFGLAGEDTVLSVKLWFEWHVSNVSAGHMRLYFVNSTGSWRYHSFIPRTSDGYDCWNVTSEQSWTPALLDSLVVAVYGYDPMGGPEDFYVDYVYVEVSYVDADEGTSAEGPPHGEGPTTAVEVPNLPWYVKQILQRILDFLGQRHVRVVLGVAAFMGVGLVVLRWEKVKKK
jgi:hypothetical protein